MLELRSEFRPDFSEIPPSRVTKVVRLSGNKSDQNRTSGGKGSGDLCGASAICLMHTGDSTAATMPSWDGVLTERGGLPRIHSPRHLRTLTLSSL